MLAPRLDSEKILARSIKEKFFQTREKKPQWFFTQTKDITYGHDSNELLLKIGVCHVDNYNWDLFINNSCINLKCVMFDIGNNMTQFLLVV